MLSLLAASGAVEPLYWENYSLGPALFSIGGFELRYYSLAYLIGVIFAYWHLSKMLKAPGAPMAQRHADDLFFYGTLGVILGGRLGYVTFYKPEIWLEPLKVLQVWEGGMSFHGGLIGVVLAILWVSWRGKLNFVRVADYVCVSVPMGMMLGRLANFNNGELWGRVTDVSWGMIFCDVRHTQEICETTYITRHPSQLYQAGLEGLALLIILVLLFWKTRARYRPGLLVGIFTLGMATARFVNEFFRQPDAHLQTFAETSGLSMGQWLTLPMFLIGLIVTLYAVTRKPLGQGAATTT